MKKAILIFSVISCFTISFGYSDVYFENPPGDNSTKKYDERLCNLRPDHRGTECKVVHPQGLCWSERSCP